MLFFSLCGFFLIFFLFFLFRSKIGVSRTLNTGESTMTLIPAKIEPLIVQQNEARENQTLHPTLATFSRNALRRQEERSDRSNDLRPPFAHDIDRIVHSHPFARYIDKAQVFVQIKQDHISRRYLHVQQVARIARTLGRFFSLNEDLIEAIAFGHDIGHTPFGHAGERILADILTERGCGSFTHNAHSVRILESLAKKGEGLNLNLQVLDGIICHNGELEQSCYSPAQELTWEHLDEKVHRCMTFPRSSHPGKNFRPSTMEGCVVRLSDIIAYLGKDIEDAIDLDIVRRDELPSSAVKILGNTNAQIIDTLCKDILSQSYGKETISISTPVFQALKTLKKFNYERIYNCPLLKDQLSRFQWMFRLLFDRFLDDLKQNRTDSIIIKGYLSQFTRPYPAKTPERIVADYIAGMTDDFFLAQFQQNFLPHRYGYTPLWENPS